MGAVQFISKSSRIFRFKVFSAVECGGKTLILGEKTRGFTAETSLEDLDSLLVYLHSLYTFGGWPIGFAPLLTQN